MLKQPKNPNVSLVTSNGRRYMISTTTPTLIGRQGCAILLADPSVAPQHARIVCSPEGTYCTVDPLAQTFVNGIALHAPIVLQAGDRLRLGSTELILQFGDGMFDAPISLRGALDVAFLFDTTGSMYRFLLEVRKNLTRLTEELARGIGDLRVAVIAYGDHTDEHKTYLVKVLPFTSDLQAVIDFLNTVRKTGGGGDGPEALEDALYEVNRLEWRTRMDVARSAIVVGDAPPHDVLECTHGRDYRTEFQAIVARNTRVHSVLCGKSLKAETVFQEFAKRSEGKLIRLTSVETVVDVLVGLCMQEAARLVGQA